MKKKEKNILLVSLGKMNPDMEHRYYYCEEGGVARYCDVIQQAEAATKYVLSKVKIDELVVIGSGSTYDEGDEVRKILLGEGTDFYLSDPAQLSEYSFFRYRIAEYLQNVDLEKHEILGGVSEEEEKELVSIFNNFHSELGKSTGKKRTDTLFNRLRKEPELFEQLKEQIQHNPGVQVPWMKQYIYSKLSDSYKLKPLEVNESLLVSFIPTEKYREDNVNVHNLMQIINALTGNEDEMINLYVDMQGLERLNDYTMITLLSILNNEWNNRIQMKQILSTQSAPSQFAGAITNVLERYEMNNLLAGMNAFISYGKAGMLKKYWEERNIDNKHVEDLIYAMQYIDDGVSLCNISDLEYGILQLKKAFAERNTDSHTDMESSVIAVLEEGILRDYGLLLEDDGSGEVDIFELIKWCYRKKFYHQTLTIIESRIPEDFVKRGVLYYARNEEDKETVLEAMSEEYNRTQSKDRYKFRVFDHFFIKFYGRFLLDYRQDPVKVQQDYAQLRVGQLTQDNPKLVKAYSLVEDKEKLEELLYSYYWLGNIRNSVSHSLGGVKMYPRQRAMHRENENIRTINEAIEYFILMYDEVRKEIDGKEFSGCTITGNELKDYAFSHGRKNFGGNRYGGYKNDFRKKEDNVEEAGKTVAEEDGDKENHKNYQIRRRMRRRKW